MTLLSLIGAGLVVCVYFECLQRQYNRKLRVSLSLKAALLSNRAHLKEIRSMQYKPTVAK